MPSNLIRYQLLFFKSLKSCSPKLIYVSLSKKAGGLRLGQGIRPAQDSVVSRVTARLVCWAAETDYCTLGVVKQQNFLLSLFWRLEVQNKGVGRVTLSHLGSRSRGVCGGSIMSLLGSGVCQQSLACRHLTAVSSSVFTWLFSPGVSMSSQGIRLCVSV